ncbi:hypothetical protein SUDANB146_00289 [Streptomyces sp. enrichment culture]
MVGPDAGVREEAGDGDGEEAVGRAHDDLQGRGVVEEDLAAAAARRDDSPVAVADGDDRLQVVGALCGGRSDDDRFGAGTAGEVTGVHGGDDPAVRGAGRRGHGVVVAPAAGAGDVRRGRHEFLVDVVGVRGPACPPSFL